MSHAARIAAANLRVDHATAQVLRAFQGAGVDSLLLKGPSIARWLYPEGGVRAYIDQDLLVPPASLATAAAALTDIGFVPHLDERQMPAWWREHAVEWRHPEAGIVDLHQTLTGVGVDADTLWSVLFADAVQLVVGAVAAHALSIPARALHVALHAAQHGGQAGLGDLDRALGVVDGDTWRAAAELARRLRAAEAFAAGLAIRPKGAALASSLGLPERWSVDVEVRAARAASEALTVDRFVRASGLRARISIVRHKLLPPATFMRHWSPQASRGRLSLARAYARRIVWILTRSRPAVSAWRAARRGHRRSRHQNSHRPD